MGEGSEPVAILGPTTSKTVTSKDGTPIAYEQAGTGPALILVDAAGHYRELSSFGGMIGLLAADFTVYHYDRRGRGDSADTQPYAVEREIDDLAALIDEAGGSAFLYGFSSGGLVALHAAASGLTIPRLALLEPPIETNEDRSAQAAFTAELAELLAARGRAAAVDYFLTGIGVPGEIIAGMREDQSWSAMEAVAHTLVYDCMVSEATSFQLLASVRVPTLVLGSEGSGDDLTGMATAVAKTLPKGFHRSLPGGWHGVPDDVLAPVLTEFFKR
ncbi:alpha/beta fold hydrolase [Micromonospora sp. U21]|uniref:alpha/beta fold hydrolase n=1 Tax=Micromonospora sp. U21 TaxID=2824899 RepID=UPI001B381F7D|nr:alpha/beta hydrolase [Micromonospora sp. U21]MBQ0905279.1 alpha/beta hydrolase [Micromonospora sp. U21]